MNDYYNENALAYYKSTIDLDPSSFLSLLAEQLRQGALILDIGCGSGRDLLWLKRKGYYPTGLERSADLAGLARRISGCPVMVDDFMSFDFADLEFDALLLVGSLVHLDRSLLKPVLFEICKALKKNGYLLLTLKEGEGQQQSKDGRVFTLWQKAEVDAIFLDLNLKPQMFNRQTSRLRQEDTWLTYLASSE
jgi:SAM-dependent methyltransferase